MEGEADPNIYKGVLIVLATAAIIIPLFLRFRLSPILGFLLVGIIVGPSVLGRLALDYPWLKMFVVTDFEQISHLAELGVAFLLFMIGLELSLRRFLTMRRLVLGLGGLQVLVSAIVIAAIAALALPATEAVILGSALALSSTAIVVEILAQQRRLNTMTGRATFSVLLLQDLAVVPILLLVTILGRREGGMVWTGLALALFQAGLTIAVVVLVGRFLLGPLFRLVAGTRSSDLFLAATLLVIVGTGLITNMSGLSMALGAFLAGLLLAETEYRREIESLIDPFRGLLLGAFFLLVGMGINLTDVAARPLSILGLAAALIAIKAAVVLMIGWWLRIERDAVVESALLLGPGGEFAFVILGAAAGTGLVSAAANQTALVAVSVSMAAIPLMSVIGRQIGRRIRPAPILPPEALEELPETEAPQVVIAGFGRVGQLVASMLMEHGIPYIAIDADPGVVSFKRRQGEPVYYGDVSRPAFLRRSGIQRARMLVVTLDDHGKVEAVVAQARGLNPKIVIIARARDDRHAQRLYGSGVNEAVPETIESSLQLAESVLVESGVPTGLAIASVHERRDAYRKLLGRPDRRRQLQAERAKPPA